MIFGIISIILLLVGIVGCCIWRYKCNEEFEYTNNPDKKYKTGRTIATIGIVILAIAFILVPFSWHTVDVSEVAVVKSLGKIKEVKSNGTYFDLWLTNNYDKYSTKVQEVTLEDMAYSSDAQQMTLAIKFQYQIRTDKVKEIATKFGNTSALEGKLTPVVRDKVKSVISKHAAMDIIAVRETLSTDALTAVREAIGEAYYVEMTNVAITNIDFSDQFETAVEEKMIAEQQQLKAEYENAATVAKAQAKVEIAKAEAEAKKIAAQGDAEANKILENSLSEKVLRQKYLEKWDGKLPTTMLGDDTMLMVPAA
jgi:regulator of protease activity HflC (stomatin/prohibitin superfamily)